MIKAGSNHNTGGDSRMARKQFSGVSEQSKAGKHRMDDARALFEAKRWRGSMYMAGYSVECLLKTKLMRKFQCFKLRELEEKLQRRRMLPTKGTIFTHELEVLLGLTGAIGRLRQNAVQLRSFSLVNQWIPAWRYKSDLSNLDDAKDFLDAVETISRWIENNI